MVAVVTAGKYSSQDTEMFFLCACICTFHLMRQSTQILNKFFLFHYFCIPGNHLALRKYSSQDAAAWSIFPLNIMALKWKCQGLLCTDSIVKKSTHLQKPCSKVETEQWNNHESSWSLRTRKTSDLLQCVTTKGEIWTVIWAFMVTNVIRSEQYRLWHRSLSPL